MRNRDYAGLYGRHNLQRGSNMKKKKRSTDKVITNLIFLVPGLLLMFFYVVYPIFFTGYLSFFEWNGFDPVKKFVGLENWRTLLADKVFFKGLINNLWIVILSVAIQIPAGFLLAAYLMENRRFGKFLKTVYFLPMLMSAVSIGILFKHVLEPNFGLVSFVWQKIAGTPLDLLGNTATALVTVILVICWEYTPFYMVLFLSGLATISGDLREYAKVEGAGSWQYYVYIAIPMLKENIFTAITLSVIGSLKYFDLVYVLTNGGPMDSTELMATYMYKNAFRMWKMGYGSTIAIALFFVVIFFSVTIKYGPGTVKRRRKVMG